MKCPVCQKKITDGEICPHCKANIIFWLKMKNYSRVLYNQALDNAKRNNLDLALKDLNKSLVLEKNNIAARNLLGLIYFKTGKIADALKHWVISNSIKKNDCAERYILISQENPKILDMYNEAIKFYNLGLEYIKQNNDDMGVINLKRSLELNPDFIDAMNLLALCYIYQEKRDEAKKLLERVLFIDRANILAKRYYKDFIREENKECDNNIKARKNNLRARFAGVFNFSSMIIFFSGILFALIIIYVLVYPTQINNKDEYIKRLEKELDIAQNSYESLNSKMPEIKKENDELLKKNVELEKKILADENKKMLDEAEDLYKKSRFIDALEIILKIDFSQGNSLPDGANDLKEKIYYKATKIYYEDGLSLYRKKDYKQAKEIFEKALSFDDGRYKDKINFYLEKINLIEEES